MVFFSNQSPPLHKENENERSQNTFTFGFWTCRDVVIGMDNNSFRHGLLEQAAATLSCILSATSPTADNTWISR
jgi:hypothetical protein